jgi:hypothetical protein
MREHPMPVELAEFGDEYIKILRRIDVTDITRCVEVEQELLHW